MLDKHLAVPLLLSCTLFFSIGHACWESVQGLNSLSPHMCRREAHQPTQHPSCLRGQQQQGAHAPS